MWGQGGCDVLQGGFHCLRFIYTTGWLGDLGLFELQPYNV